MASPPGTGQARIDVDNNSFETDGNDPNLYQVDLGLNDQIDPISSLTFNFDGPAGDSSNMAILAVSGVTVPEPSSGIVLGIAALANLPPKIPPPLNLIRGAAT